jgi:regulator of RNase E activity RraA
MSVGGKERPTMAADDDTGGDLRELDISDEERIERFKTAGYGGNVSDALWNLGIKDTVLSQRFGALQDGTVLAGRALPVKLHSHIESDAERERLEEKWERQGGHPQMRMMEAVRDSPDGTVLCFDCGGDMQPAHFGEMSCTLADANGCRGMVVAGNMRDTKYVVDMDFPAFCFGTTPNAFGGWDITEVNVPIHMEGHVTHYVDVHPGDFVFGDRDGVQIIPEAVVDEVLLRVEETHAEEEEERRRIREGMSIEEVYDEFGVL